MAISIDQDIGLKLDYEAGQQMRFEIIPLLNHRGSLTDRADISIPEQRL